MLLGPVGAGYCQISPIASEHMPKSLPSYSGGDTPVRFSNIPEPFMPSALILETIDSVLVRRVVIR